MVCDVCSFERLELRTQYALCGVVLLFVFARAGHRTRRICCRACLSARRRVEPIFLLTTGYASCEANGGHPDGNKPIGTALRSIQPESLSYSTHLPGGASGHVPRVTPRRRACHVRRCMFGRGAIKSSPGPERLYRSHLLGFRESLNPRARTPPASNRGAFCCGGCARCGWFATSLQLRWYRTPISAIIPHN